ncbi:hypothetical protein BGZ73_002432 [Actinomortierella ambigua]|nr:hypothetical protein BGZ73_002432 [Actinomortierella ambigua]
MAQTNKLTLDQWLATPRRAPLPRDPRDGNTPDLVHTPWAQNVKNGLPTDPVEIYRNPEWHGSAVSSVLTKSSTITGFYPAAGLEEAANHFDDYIRQVSSFPGFVLVSSEETGSHDTSVDVSKIVNAIVDAYSGFVSADIKKVEQSVSDMANSILNHSSKQAHKGIFTQSTVDNQNGTFTTTIFFATLDMSLDTSGKYTYTEQTYKIMRSVLQVNGAWLSAHAEELAQKIDGKSIDDWINGSSSPTGKKVSCAETQLGKTANVVNIRAIPTEP